MPSALSLSSLSSRSLAPLLDRDLRPATSGLEGSSDASRSACAAIASKSSICSLSLARPSAAFASSGETPRPRHSSKSATALASSPTSRWHLLLLSSSLHLPAKSELSTIRSRQNEREAAALAKSPAETRSVACSSASGNVMPSSSAPTAAMAALLLSTSPPSRSASISALTPSRSAKSLPSPAFLPSLCCRMALLRSARSGPLAEFSEGSAAWAGAEIRGHSFDGSALANRTESLGAAPSTLPLSTTAVDSAGRMAEKSLGTLRTQPPASAEKLRSEN